MLYFACSRKREYLADASAARFTRYPEGLASALEKISGSVNPKRAAKEVQRALAPMYIINPLQAASRRAGLFSTHPPAAKRIAILRAMGGNAGWVDYERACRKVTGGGSGIDATTLRSEGSVAARKPTSEPGARKGALERGREVGDLLDRMFSFLILACPCGVRIKVPPDLKRTEVACTRCGRKLALPHAEKEKPAADVNGAGPAPLVYKRQGEGWETFKCSCGQVLQISPAFEGDELRCKKCRRRIHIKSS
jgi:heat shock protein HtpX